MEIKITLLWDVTPCSLVTNLLDYPAALFVQSLSSALYSEDGGSVSSKLLLQFLPQLGGASWETVFFAVRK
jgi:hypothetical protein